MTSRKSPLWALAVVFFLLSLAVGWWGFRRPHVYADPFTAARDADPPTIDYHLSRGLDPNVRDERGRTLLELLATRHVDERRAGDIEYGAARLLLEAGADPNAESNGTRPLHAACVHVKARMIQLMLKHGADPNLRDGHGRTALMNLGRNGIATINVAQNLVNAGADVSAVAPDGYTALKHAEQMGARDFVAFLRARGAVE
ncbi:MAG: ankyrin repeat domain-containing protein [Planctomycetota bacterium]